MFIFGKGERKVFPQIPYIVGDGPARRQMVGHFKGTNAKFGCVFCLFPSIDQSVEYDGRYKFYLYIFVFFNNSIYFNREITS